MSKGALQYTHRCRREGTLMMGEPCDERRKIAQRQKAKSVEEYELISSCRRCLDCEGALKLAAPIEVAIDMPLANFVAPSQKPGAETLEKPIAPADLPAPPTVRPEGAGRDSAPDAAAGKTRQPGPDSVRGQGQKDGRAHPGKPASLPRVPAPGRPAADPRPHAGTLALRAGAAFKASRKLGKGHQNVLVFVKGSPQRATQALGEVEPEIDLGDSDE